MSELDGAIAAEALAWKKRALRAESLLHNYRKLDRLVDRVAEAWRVGSRLSSLQDRLEDPLNELFIESGLIEHHDPPKAIFDQKSIELEEGVLLSIEQVVGLGVASTLDLTDATIRIEANQPLEGKAIALMYQLLQAADIAASAGLGLGPAIGSKRLYGMSGAMLSLLAKIGLLDDSLGIVSEGILRFVEARRAASKGS